LTEKKIQQQERKSCFPFFLPSVLSLPKRIPSPLLSSPNTQLFNPNKPIRYARLFSHHYTYLAEMNEDSLTRSSMSSFQHSSQHPQQQPPSQNPIQSIKVPCYRNTGRTLCSSNAVNTQRYWFYHLNTESLKEEIDE